MNSIFTRCFFFALLLSWCNAHSQNKIYLKSIAKQAKISSINPTAVVYTVTGRESKPITLPTSDVQLAFNEKGDFIAPAKMDFNNKQTSQLIAQFLNPSSFNLISDQVYTMERKKTEGYILSENDSALFIAVNGTNNKILKKGILAVIYKDGRHHLYLPASDVAAALWDIKAKTDSSTNIASAPNVDKPAAVTTPDTKMDSSTNKSDTTHKLSFEDFAKEVPKEEFIKKATDKTQRLTQYLKILYDKSADNEEKNKTIEQAITLFVDENAQVEVSSVNRDLAVKSYKIRKYLQHIKLVNYEKIEIEWTNVQYVSDVRKGPDGNYYGTVEFEQVFKGYRDAQLVYSDITRKTANVVMKTYEKNYEGKSTTLWDVLLSNVGVVSTKSL